MQEQEILSLIKLAKVDNSAMDTLLEFFKPKVIAISRQYFLIGADYDDLIQEGMIGLYKAINIYDEDKNNNFSAFASLCIHRQLQNAVKNANSKKNSFLNSYVPISLFDDKDDNEQNLKLVIKDDNSDIEAQYISTEIKSVVVEKVKDLLTEEQFKILKMFLNGYSYAQIAERNNKTVKEVDNTLQAIKRKLATLKNVV